jgi:hypothetical protein
MQRADEERRRRENAEVLHRMKRGDNLCHTDLGAYRWAPRPPVKKDKKALEQLYGKQGPQLAPVEG